MIARSCWLRVTMAFGLVVSTVNLFSAEPAKEGGPAKTEPVEVKPGKTITNSIGMKLVLIPAGEFLMGSPETQKGRRPDETQHRVRITKPFYLGAYEVTQAEFERVMEFNPSNYFTSRKGADKVLGMKTDNFPVQRISWIIANAFCSTLSETERETYRLPTEAEWEYACRAGTTTAYHVGNLLTSADARSSDDINEFMTPTTVGTYSPNRFGLYDMHGNVCEWCSDWYDENYYAHSPLDDPTGPSSGSRHVLRGGMWERSVTSANRARAKIIWNCPWFGFRVVLVPADGKEDAKSTSQAGL